MKGAAFLPLEEDAVEEQRVEMDVEIQSLATSRRPRTAATRSSPKATSVTRAPSSPQCGNNAGIGFTQ
jgi:hypothetical protein